MSESHLPTHYDTVVAGSGPAGVMAALHAAARGSVLLVDAAKLPRDKSCGGMLNEYSQEFLSHFGEIPAEMILDPQWVNFRYHDWDRKHPQAHGAALPQRRSSRLRRLAGRPAARERHRRRRDERGRLRPGRRRGSRPPQGRTEARRPSRCENLIGADGPRSSVRRQLGAGSVATYVTLQDFCRSRVPSSPSSTASTCATSATSSATPTWSPRATSPSSARSSTPRPSGRT